MNYSIEKLEKLYQNDATDTLRTVRTLSGVDATHTLIELTMLPLLEEEPTLSHELISSIFPKLMMSGYELIRMRPQNDDVWAFESRMIQLLSAYYDTDITGVTYSKVKHTLNVLTGSEFGEKLIEQFVKDSATMQYVDVTKSDVINQMHYALETIYTTLNDKDLSDTVDCDLFDLQVNTRFTKTDALAYSLLNIMYRNAKIENVQLPERLKNQLSVFFNQAETIDVMYLVQRLAFVYATHYLANDNFKHLPYVENEDSHEPFEEAIRQMDAYFLINDTLMPHFVQILDQLDEPKVKTLDWLKINQAFIEALYFETQMLDFENNTDDKQLCYSVDVALVPVTSGIVQYVSEVVNDTDDITKLMNVTCNHRTQNNGREVVSTFLLNDAYSKVTFYENDDDGNSNVIKSEMSDKIDSYYMTDDARYAIIPIVVPIGWENNFKMCDN